MADTYTTNLNLTKPEPGAAEDTWGISLNADLDSLDAIFGSGGTAVSMGAVTMDGLTVNGDATLSDTNPTLSLVDTTATNQGAEFKHNAGTTTIQSSNTSTHGLIKFNSNNGTDTVTRMQIDRFGDISFYDDTGTSQSFFWDSSAERLGIGTTSPSTTLHVADTSASITIQDSNSSGNTAAAKILFADSGTFGTIGTIGFAGNDDLKIENNHTGNILLSGGNVGVGTDSPSTKLMLEHNNDGAVGGTIRIKDRDTQQSANQLTGAIEFESQDGTIPTSGVSTAIKAFSASSSGGSYLTISTTDINTSTLDERLRVTADGSVGIGTDSPTSRLTIASGSNSTNTGDGIHFFGTSSNNQAAIQSFNTGAYYGDLRFYTSNHGTASTSIGDERLRIARNGDISFYDDTGSTQGFFWDASAESLGIGTTSPDSLLHIKGGDTSIGTLKVQGGKNTVTSVGEVNSRLDFGSNDGSVNSTGNVGGRIASVTEISNGANTGLAFSTFKQGTGLVEYLRLTNDGNVGIGTVSPSAKLSIHAAVNNPAIEIVPTTDENSADSAVLRLWGTRFGTANRYSEIRNVTDGSTANNELAFNTNGSEALRIDSSQNLLVGKTASGLSTDGAELAQGGTAGKVQITRTSNAALLLNRRSTDGTIADFRKDGSTVGTIGTLSGHLTIGNDDTGLIFNKTVDSIYPWNVSTNSSRDNAVDLGFSSARFKDIYATNGTIQTSDINEKQDIEELSEAETRVAVAVKGLLKKYRWKSAVADKGDDARIHFGIMAQDLQQAFSAEGLDAGDYGMFISSTWTDETTGEEKTRLGVRYNELLAFIIAAI